MKSPSLPERAIGGIKTVSTLLMSGAIALESYNLIDPFISPSLPIGVTGLIILERIAVSIHLLEAIAAACLAPSRQQHPLKTCIYTFFVGTVGLWELLATPRTGE